MPDQEPALKRALEQIDAPWDAARTERTLPGARRKQVQRRMRTGAALALGALALVVTAGVALRASMLTQEARVAQPLAAEPRVVSFADGSRALLLDATAQVVVEHATEHAVDVRLPRGRARFEIAQRKERSFRVLCEEVEVEVIGTRFELTRAGARTHVSVLQGRVAVRWPGGEVELGAGDAGWYPASEQAVQPEVPSETARALPTVRAAQPERTRTSSWRQHAEQGEFQEAFALLERERTRVSDDVEELLLAADAARLSNHAAQAVPYLQRVVSRHAGDPRAPLAAFTLGGVLMNQLGRPREAGEAYARARALSPSSALSQDALARQVEAAHRASDAAAARVLALEYLERYPDGRRVQAVRRFGGLP